jgi:beta-galactosidase
MWSVGNEISEQKSAAGADLYAQMQAYVHALDAEKTRPVTAGASWMPQAIKSGFIEKMDIPAVTYRLPFYEAIHAASPRKGRMLGIETASTVSSRATYHFPVKVCDWAEHPDGQSSGYDVEYCPWSNLPDDDWAMQDDRPWTIGEFVWTGFDYLGEPTPYDNYWPSRSSYFGIFDLAGLPKDRYWLYRSRWNTQSPTLHICPSHWNFKGREGDVTPVYVYTSYPCVELFVNGVSHGRRRFDPHSRLDRYRLRWNDVRYRPGEVKAVAYDWSGAAVAEKTIRTAGKAAKVLCSTERFGRLVFARATLVDAQGRWVPDEDRMLSVEATGGMVFKGQCNGDPTSLTPFVSTRMKTFRGELVAVGEGLTGALQFTLE